MIVLPVLDKRKKQDDTTGGPITQVRSTYYCMTPQAKVRSNLKLSRGRRCTTGEDDGVSCATVCVLLDACP
jgi:hypothetical protein